MELHRKVVTVKDLKEKLKDLPDDLPVGYVGPYSTAHLLHQDDVYLASGHYDPLQSETDWRKLMKEFPVKRILHLNCAQVGPRQNRGYGHTGISLDENDPL